ncbi:MAG TPA: hypothetical protein PKE06_08940 [Flavilitoribacter sp.]|nr:hypothetical protein [Flavilitoribacter sp.]HMQ89772.1 hypothetical protein [Flavilitoribacter sp.]
MSDTIFILNDQGELNELSESFYDSEDLLQGLLATYPKLLAGSQMNNTSPRKWLLISRELGISDQEGSPNRWALDHLFIDQDAIPTLVEVKRSTDTRLRREVIGQILDYAANSTAYWSIGELEFLYKKTCEQFSEDPEIKLIEFLENEQEVSIFWEKVDTNLKAGKIRLLIVADIIPKELLRIIEFLNEQMSPAEILGLEVKQYVGESLKTLVPKLVGQTTQSTLKKKVKILGNQTQINEEEYWKVFHNQSGKVKAGIAKRIVDWVRNKCDYLYIGGRGIEYGFGHSIVPVTRKQLGDKMWDILPFSIWTNGTIEISFQYYKNRPPMDSIENKKKLAEQLNTIQGVEIPENKLSKRPNFDLIRLEKKRQFGCFFTSF